MLFFILLVLESLQYLHKTFAEIHTLTICMSKSDRKLIEKNVKDIKVLLGAKTQ